MLGPVENGGTIIAHTAPGCWGPMITPRLRGGHEVTQLIFVDGAKLGDGVAIRIRDITVTALATAPATTPRRHASACRTRTSPRVARSAMNGGRRTSPVLCASSKPSRSHTGLLERMPST